VADALRTDEAIAAGVLNGLLAALVWGVQPVVTRSGIDTLTPYDLTALRFAVAGLVLLPLVWRQGVGRIGWTGTIVLACGAGVPYMLMNAGGLCFAPAGHNGVILPSGTLIFSTLGGWLFFGDKPDRTRLLGLMAIIAGVVLVGLKGLSAGQGEWIGDLMFFAGGFFWATFTVGSQAYSVTGLHGIGLVSVVSMVLYLPPYLLFADSKILQAPVSVVVFQAIFHGIFAAILALLFYTRSIAVLGAARGAVFATLTPALAVLLSFVVLGEVPSWIEFLGLAMVTAGMIVALGLHQSGLPSRWRRKGEAARG
jgi:drug/metabolite transporter (DMT)-like permease